MLTCSSLVLFLFASIAKVAVAFKPADKDELQVAVDLWCSDRASALSTYGVEIGSWDTSLITSMSGLFHNKGKKNSLMPYRGYFLSH